MEAPSGIPTSASLLQRLRTPEAPAAWPRFVQLYTPLLFAYARKLGLSVHAAEDLVQDVFVVLFKTLPEFEYDPRRRFRGWLWTVFRNQYLARVRQADPIRDACRLATEELPATDMPEEWVEEEYRQYVTRRMLELIRSDFKPRTWAAYWECVVQGRPVAEVAAELGMSHEAVWKAKGRVVGRIAQELDRLLD